MANISNPMGILVLDLISKDKNNIYESFFSDPPSCLVIYRLLPEIYKILIIRALNSSETGILQNSYLKNNDLFINTKSKINDCILGLLQIKILEKINDQIFKINEKFFVTMKKLLSEGLDFDKQKFRRKARGYEKYLDKGINLFYKFINEKVFDQFGKVESDSEINKFLLYAGLLSKDQEKKYQIGNLPIFLNKTEELITSFFYKYLTYNIDMKILDEQKFKFFHLLFYLATLEPGTYFTSFPEQYYDPSLEKHLDFMNQTGFLIMKPETKNGKIIKKYFCTPLIQSLFENNNISEDYSLIKYGDENANRFLYVETNMKFYAFMPELNKKKKEKQTALFLGISEMNSSTNLSNIIEKEPKESKDERVLFYINLLKSMFTIEMILPDNGLIGYITRENLKKIFKQLTNSNRLLQFLSDHMSLNNDDVTDVGDKKYLINESVVNQISILENEKKSIEIVKSVACYYDFFDSKQYQSFLTRLENDNIKPIKKEDNDMIVVISGEDAKKLKNRYQI
jgi:hypothetical protein